MALSEFISDEYQKRRQRNPNFSVRAFARWLGISPAQLSQMMTGKRTVTLSILQKITDRLDTAPSEKRALMASVFKDHGLIDDKQKRKIQLKEDQFQMISDWFHLAILSLTKVKGASSDPRWISKQLGISLELAHQALLRLEKLGIITTKPFKQISEPFEVISEIPSAAIRKYHKQNLDLAAEKLETVPIEFRQFQSVSLTIKTSMLPKFKKMIDQFLDEATELDQPSAGTDVYHLNVQLFPVTRIKEN